MERKVLKEIRRQDLLRKGKREHPARFERRMNYVNSIKPVAVAKELFVKTGTLTVPISIGDYIVTVHVSGIMKRIRTELDSANKTLPDRPLVYRALRKAVDESNIYVECTCPDFRYRFAYTATIKDYKYGKPEKRPASITNPHNEGSTCKHITAGLVRPSQWLKYVAGWISTVVRAYLQNKLDLDLEDINDLAPKIIKDTISDIKDLDDSMNVDDIDKVAIQSSEIEDSE